MYYYDKHSLYNQYNYILLILVKFYLQCDNHVIVFTIILGTNNNELFVKLNIFNIILGFFYFYLPSEILLNIYANCYLLLS